MILKVTNFSTLNNLGRRYVTLFARGQYWWNFNAVFIGRLPMYFGSVNLSQKFSWLKRKFSRLRTNGNASFWFPFFYRLYVHFYFDISEVFVFLDVYGIRVEDTIDVSLYFMEIRCYCYCPLELYISRRLKLYILTTLNYDLWLNYYN